MFKGLYTAIVTPFKAGGEIDETALCQLVEEQVKAGVAGLVPCGTTGESPTLTTEEHKQVVKIVVEQVNHRCQVIGGAGSNSTTQAIVYTKMCKEIGCDAVLSVNPYYNKPTQEGLYRHFKSIAEAVPIPIILYNIKSRTGVNIETPTLLKLITSLPNIVGVKEASGDIDQIKQVITETPENFSVLSGDDNITLDLIKAGGHGVISVISNLVPEKMNRFVQASLNSDDQADNLNQALLPLMQAVFIETNPIPIKAMVAMMGLIEEVYRLPICELRPNNRDKIKQLLLKEGLLKA